MTQYLTLFPFFAVQMEEEQVVIEHPDDRDDDNEEDHGEEEDVVSDIKLGSQSMGSSDEMRKFRHRFDADRQTQTLNKEQSDFLHTCLEDHPILWQWEHWRVQMGHVAQKTMGLANHHLAPMNWYYYESFMTQISKSKPLRCWVNGRVHVFKIVQAYLCPPIKQVGEDQYAPMTPHEGREMGVSYQAQIVVDWVYWCLKPPPGYIKPLPEEKGPNGRWLNKMPEDWETTFEIESREWYPRQPYHRFIVMNMSMLDRRSNGTLPPESHAREDPYHEGGDYSGPQIPYIMPLLERLLHNKRYVSPGVGYANSTIVQGCRETPDLTEPWEVRNAKAIYGEQQHRTVPVKIETRHVAPTRIPFSTATNSTFGGKQKKGEHDAGEVIENKFQYLNKKIHPGITLACYGCSMDQAYDLARKRAGIQWYPEAFKNLWDKLKDRYPVEIDTQYNAWMYIADRADKKEMSEEKKIKYVEDVMCYDIKPSSGLSIRYKMAKCLEIVDEILAIMLYKCGFGFFDFKDYYGNQGYDQNAMLWAGLERQIYNKSHLIMEKAVRNLLYEKATHFPWRQISAEQKFSENAERCVTKGIWAINCHASGPNRTGVTLPEKATNYLTYAALVRRANTATSRSKRRSLFSRQIDETQFGRLCCIKTPEGEMCGIARFQSAGSTTTTASSNRILMGILQHLLPKNTIVTAEESPWIHIMQKNLPYAYYWIDVDGKKDWHTRQPHEVLALVRKLRRSGVLSPYVGCFLDKDTVCIRTFPGRNVRLLLVLRKWLDLFQTRALSDKEFFQLGFQESLQTGVIEFVDAEEERALSVCYSFADYKKRTMEGEQFTHMELDSSFILDITAGIVPNIEYSQTPRAILGAAMNSAAVGMIANPFKFTTMSYQLNNLQVPIAKTRAMKDFDCEDMSLGNHVDITMYATPHNIEDGFHTNKAYHQRGGVEISMTVRYCTTVKTSPSGHNGRIEKLECPGFDCIGKQEADYSKIGINGLPVKGTHVCPGDIIIGKTIEEGKVNAWAQIHEHLKEDQESLGIKATTELNLGGLMKEEDGEKKTTIKRDDSISIRDETGVVEEVRTTHLANGSEMRVEIQIRVSHVHEQGDKFSMRHGQKGTGAIYSNPEDMPFSCTTGKPAVLLMNPLSDVGRMTIGVDREMLRTKAAAIMGVDLNSTAFLSDTLKQKEVDATAVLLQAGFKPLGYERHIDGITGKMIERPLFRGIVFWSALAHLVKKKKHARDKGPIKEITRQPHDGRSKDGGFRFGGMEIDDCAALGLMVFLLERLKHLSDAFRVAICKRCQTIADYSRKTGVRGCRSCRQTDQIVIVWMSYTNKLITQEYMFLSQKMGFITCDENLPVSSQASEQSIQAQKEIVQSTPSLLDISQGIQPKTSQWKRFGIQPLPDFHQFLSKMSDETAASMDTEDKETTNKRKVTIEQEVATKREEPVAKRRRVEGPENVKMEIVLDSNMMTPD